MDTFLAILTVFSQPELLVLVGLGTFVGIYIGAIPGLFGHQGGVYDRSRTAILLNIPGAPSAISTALDGYPMAQHGEAGQAIGVTTVMSFLAA